MKDLRLFNLALLGRQVWRLIHNKDTLCFQIFLAKYFPDGDIFNHKKVDKPSFAWSNISKAANELADGFGWQIGTGQHVNLMKHRWGFEGLSWKEVINAQLGNVSVVRDL